MSSYYESRKYRKHTGKAVPDATSGEPLREVEDDLKPMITEFVYTWPDGREEVRYRREKDSDEALLMMDEVKELQHQNQDSPYSFRHVPGTTLLGPSKESPDSCSITLHEEPPDLSRERPTTSLEFLD